MRSRRLHPYTVVRNYFREDFTLPPGHVVTLNNNEKSLTTYDLASALNDLQGNIDASTQDASNKIASTNSNLATTNSNLDTTNTNVADVKKIATSATALLGQLPAVSEETLAAMGLKLIGPESSPPANPDNIPEGKTWPRVVFCTLDTYNSLEEANAAVSQKSLFGKQMQLCSINDWPFATAWLGQTWWANANHPCCAKVGYGYKKKDGYINLEATNDIFGVATYRDANPALCWVDYDP